MKLAITICATQNYTYALKAQARRIQACLDYLSEEDRIYVVLSGDNSKEILDVVDLYKNIMPDNYEIIHLGTDDLEKNLRNYKEEAQLLIAQLRTRAFTEARRLKVDYCWSLDSDVLPPENGFKCMKQMLEFDDGYYSVSTCTYPSQGGGGFLGGRGTPKSQICDDFYEDEREIPEELKGRQKKHEEAFKDFMELKQEPDKKWQEELAAIREEIKKCPPKENVFALNAKGWRKRGWLENAYPGIGKGAVLPSDWCGFGCTLMNKKALNLAHFDGYDGRGTEDLYICWSRWYPAGLKINVIAHCLADHIIRKRDEDHNISKLVHCQPYHETEGDYAGHIRLRYRPWYSQDIGEKYDENNDGVFMEPVDTVKDPELVKEVPNGARPAN